MDSYLPATRLTLVCHGVTKAQRRAAFPLDEPLEPSECGRIEALGWMSPRAQQILVGPELRALETAQALGLEAKVSPSLRECDYGSWSGLELDAIQARDPAGLGTWLTETEAAPHGGESIVRLIGRIGSWMEEQRGAGHTIAVTHPAVIRGALVYALGSPTQAFWRIDIPPLSLTDLRFNGRLWTVRSSGCALRSASGSRDSTEVFE
ncbi:histidine phosphatase family protein [Granulicella sp. L60]|uniref:histidine phosphatase family protein n=1 Tax=Granulicella sp. L60 TaxID=1641866 RepID=UPI00131C907A|nr:histidine phosphatase family protein [Granulicella sp. L60]